jgi:hypothetical protein
MNKLQHLKATKSFLRKVVNYRKTLINTNHSRKPTVTMVKTIAEVEYWLPDMQSFDRMERYISQLRVQVSVRELIPSNKPKWISEFEFLITEGERQRMQDLQIKKQAITR